MSVERMRTIERLFHEALELPESERRTYVITHAPDVETATEVLTLIAADGAPDAVWKATPEDLASAAGIGASRLIGHTLGPYRIIERIGQGGMGTVYRAEREDLGTQVAIKVVRGALGDPARVLRFRQEQRVLARLVHPRIARLLDAGVAPDETPYLVMEYVEGEAITDWCDARGLDVDARLRLFTEVCDAVGFAHRNLVVHRDIKPSNVLVAANGHVKLLDFGVAKLLEVSDDDPALTATGARILSPEYAAPEQVRGEPVTTATDVHGLGLLLCALLRHASPRGARQPDAQPLIAESSGKALRDTRNELVGDLRAICQCALEEEPAHRYASVDLLRDDVIRHLDGRPVRARRPTASYRLGKFVRRHALGVSAAVLLVLLVAAGIGAVLWQAQRATRARAAAEELSSFLVGMFEASDPAEARGIEITARDLLERGTVRVSELDARPNVQARLLDAMANAYLGLADYDRAAQLAERSLEQERALHGARHEDTAARLSTLGSIRFEEGREEDADSLFRLALAVRRERLGDTDDLTTASMLDLVQVLHRTGGYDEAEALAREALAARVERHGPDHELIADALGSLALVLWYGGRDLEQAESLLRESLAMRERLFGDTDPRIEAALTPLSGFLAVRGKGAEAETVARRALDIRRQVYGDDHPLVVHQLNNVARALQAQGNYDEAGALYHEMIRRYENILDDDHPLHAIALNNLSATFYAQGALDSAEHYLRLSLDMRLRMHDDVNADVALLYHNLGSLQRAQGRFADAELALSTAYEQRIEIYGRQNPITLRTGAAYGDVLAQRGKLDRAEPLLRDILALQEEEDQDVAATRTMGYLAGVLMKRGAFDESESLYRAALDAARRLLPEAHPRRRELVAGLTALYDRLGRAEDAERVRRESAQP